MPAKLRLVKELEEQKSNAEAQAAHLEEIIPCLEQNINSLMDYRQPDRTLKIWKIHVPV